MATPLTILGPQTLPSAAGVRRAQPPFGPIHIRPWHSSSLPDLVPIDKYTHTYELKNEFYHDLNFKFSMYHFRLLFISIYKKLIDFFTYALFPGEQPERCFTFEVTERYPTMLATLLGFYVAQMHFKVGCLPSTPTDLFGIRTLSLTPLSTRPRLLPSLFQFIFALKTEIEN